METIFNLYKFRKKLEIYFPPDELEVWEQLKTRHVRLGYKWIDFSINQNYFSILWADRKNRQKYEKLLRRESSYRKSVRNRTNILPVVSEPPRPNNLERYIILRSWMKKDIYNISTISVFLFEKYSLRPCTDYSPDKIIETYNHYSNLYCNTISRRPSRRPSRQPSSDREEQRNDISRQPSAPREEQRVETSATFSTFEKPPEYNYSES